MPSTYTTSNRFEKPGLFEQESTWGITANTDYDLLDTAISGAISIAMPDSDYTLSVANGAVDEARNMVLEFTGTLTAPRAVVIPASSKVYMTSNDTNQSLTFTMGSGGVAVVPPMLKAVVVNNGTDVYVMMTNTTDAETLNGHPGSYYQNAANLTAGTVDPARLPAATDTVQGAVILLDAVNSVAVDKAAVPKSVKTAYDQAVTANTTANDARNTAIVAQQQATAATGVANTALGTANTANSTANTALSTAQAAQAAAGTAQTSANNAQITADNALGRGQNYTAVARAINQQYINTTAKPIFVQAAISCTSGFIAMQAVVNNVVAGSDVAVANNSFATLFFVVPSNGRYSVITGGGTGAPTLTSWTELR